MNATGVPATRSPSSVITPMYSSLWHRARCSYRAGSNAELDTVSSGGNAPVAAARAADSRTAAMRSGDSWCGFMETCASQSAWCSTSTRSFGSSRSKAARVARRAFAREPRETFEPAHASAPTPDAFVASAAAPAASSASQQSTRPAAAATIRGVSPVSDARASTPRPPSQAASFASASAFPCCAAQWSGVQPPESASGDAPRSRRSAAVASAAAASSSAAATASAVLPCSLRTSTGPRRPSPPALERSLSRPPAGGATPAARARAVSPSRAAAPRSPGTSPGTGASPSIPGDVFAAHGSRDSLLGPRMSLTGLGGHSGVLVASPSTGFFPASSPAGTRASSHSRTAATFPAATAACSGSTVSAVAGVTGGACSSSLSSCDRCELLALAGLSSVGVAGFDGMLMCRPR